jgi:hypothetical protein
VYAPGAFSVRNVTLSQMRKEELITFLARVSAAVTTLTDKLADLDST